MMPPGPIEYTWAHHKQVVLPPPEARPWIEVLVDLAERLGFLGEFNEIGNVAWQLKGAYRLDPHTKYSLAEISDRQIKSQAGPQYGLDSLTETSTIKGKRSVEEGFPSPFNKARVPLYYEFLIDSGQQVAAVAREMGIEWDTSDYQPLPDWRPCPSYEEDPRDGYDLTAINFKVPFQALSFSSENPVLTEMSELHPYAFKILISRKAAQERRIQDGDLVVVESRAGRVEGRAKVTEAIHPQVVAIPGIFGHWAKGLPVARGKGVHFNTLVPLNAKRIGGLGASNDFCVGVKVYKA